MECTQAMENNPDDIVADPQKIHVADLRVKKESLPIYSGINYIGRDPETCTIILNNATVSKKHAVIEVRSRYKHYITDLGSRNGTRLGFRVIGPHTQYSLTNNARVVFGECVAEYRLLSNVCYNEESDDDILSPTQEIQNEDIDKELSSREGSPTVFQLEADCQNDYPEIQAMQESEKDIKISIDSVTGQQNMPEKVVENTDSNAGATVAHFIEESDDETDPEDAFYHLSEKQDETVGDELIREVRENKTINSQCGKKEIAVSIQKESSGEISVVQNMLEKNSECNRKSRENSSSSTFDLKKDNEGKQDYNQDSNIIYDETKHLKTKLDSGLETNKNYVFDVSLCESNKQDSNILAIATPEQKSGMIGLNVTKHVESSHKKISVSATGILENLDQSSLQNAETPYSSRIGNDRKSSETIPETPDANCQSSQDLISSEKKSILVIISDSDTDEDGIFDAATQKVPLSAKSEMVNKQPIKMKDGNCHMEHFLARKSELSELDCEQSIFDESTEIFQPEVSHQISLNNLTSAGFSSSNQKESIVNVEREENSSAMRNCIGIEIKKQSIMSKEKEKKSVSTLDVSCEHVEECGKSEKCCSEISIESQTIYDVQTQIFGMKSEKVEEKIVNVTKVAEYSVKNHTENNSKPEECDIEILDGSQTIYDAQTQILGIRSKMVEETTTEVAESSSKSHNPSNNNDVNENNLANPPNQEQGDSMLDSDDSIFIASTQIFPVGRNENATFSLHQDKKKIQSAILDSTSNCISTVNVIQESSNSSPLLNKEKSPCAKEIVHLDSNRDSLSDSFSEAITQIYPAENHAIPQSLSRSSSYSSIHEEPTQCIDELESTDVNLPMKVSNFFSEVKSSSTPSKPRLHVKKNGEKENIGSSGNNDSFDLVLPTTPELKEAARKLYGDDLFDENESKCEKSSPILPKRTRKGRRTIDLKDSFTFKKPADPKEISQNDMNETSTPKAGPSGIRNDLSISSEHKLNGNLNFSFADKCEMNKFCDVSVNMQENKRLKSKKEKRSKSERELENDEKEKSKNKGTKKESAKKDQESKFQKDENKRNTYRKENKRHSSRENEIKEGTRRKEEGNINVSRKDDEKKKSKKEEIKKDEFACDGRNEKYHTQEGQENKSKNNKPKMEDKPEKEENIISHSKNKENTSRKTGEMVAEKVYRKSRKDKIAREENSTSKFKECEIKESEEEKKKNSKSEKHENNEEGSKEDENKRKKSLKEERGKRSDKQETSKEKKSKLKKSDVRENRRKEDNNHDKDRISNEIIEVRGNVNAKKGHIEGKELQDQVSKIDISESGRPQRQRRMTQKAKEYFSQSTVVGISEVAYETQSSVHQEHNEIRSSKSVQNVTNSNSGISCEPSMTSKENANSSVKMKISTTLSLDNFASQEKEALDESLTVEKLGNIEEKNDSINVKNKAKDTENTCPNPRSKTFLHEKRKQVSDSLGTPMKQRRAVSSLPHSKEDVQVRFEFLAGEDSENSTVDTKLKEPHKHLDVVVDSLHKIQSVSSSKEIKRPLSTISTIVDKQLEVCKSARSTRSRPIIARTLISEEERKSPEEKDIEIAVLPQRLRRQTIQKMSSSNDKDIQSHSIKACRSTRSSTVNKETVNSKKPEFQEPGLIKRRQLSEISEIQEKKRKTSKSLANNREDKSEGTKTSRHTVFTTKSATPGQSKTEVKKSRGDIQSVKVPESRGVGGISHLISYSEDPNVGSSDRNKLSSCTFSNASSSVDLLKKDINNIESKERGSGININEETPKHRRRRINELCTSDSDGSVCASPVFKSGMKRKLILQPNGTESDDCDSQSEGTPKRLARMKLTRRILFTGVACSKQEQTAIEKLGGKMVDQLEEAAILVTDKVRRTLKFLCMTAHGKPIVTPLWIKQSQIAGQFLDPWKFIVQDKDAEKKLHFQLEKSLKLASHQKLLTGYSVFVTPSVKPPRNEMKVIVECCGGYFLDEHPKNGEWPQNCFIISARDDKKLWREFENSSVPIVSAEALLTGILQQKLNVNQYLLKV